MTDYPKALAAARDALTKLREHDGGTRYNGDDDDAGERACCLVASWKPHDSDCPHAVAVADFENLLAAIDAARGQAVAWQVTVVDNTGTHDYAKWAGLQAPPAAVPEVLCTRCGHPTMHMGSMCYGCTQAAMLAANKVQP